MYFILKIKKKPNNYWHSSIFMWMWYFYILNKNLILESLQSMNVQKSNYNHRIFLGSLLILITWIKFKKSNTGTCTKINNNDLKNYVKTSSIITGNILKWLLNNQIFKRKKLWNYFLSTWITWKIKFIFRIRYVAKSNPYITHDASNMKSLFLLQVHFFCKCQNISRPHLKMCLKFIQAN